MELEELMKDDNELDKDIEESLMFMKVANENCVENGKMYEFECPICKEKAKAIKSSYNGHLHARCDKCDITIQQ